MSEKVVEVEEAGLEVEVKVVGQERLELVLEVPPEDLFGVSLVVELWLDCLEVVDVHRELHLLLDHLLLHEVLQSVEVEPLADPLHLPVVHLLLDVRTRKVPFDLGLIELEGVLLLYLHHLV